MEVHLDGEIIMPKFANFFATVSKDGRVLSITNANPPHELLSNQIMLTESEFYLLHAVKSIEEAKKMIRSIEYKIKQVTSDSGK